MTSAVPPGPATGHPGYLLKRAQATLNAALGGALRSRGATLAQYAVLTALDEEPGLSNAGLARRAFVTPQTMNQVLLELEQKGWVARHPDPANARIRQANLTPPGRTALRACRDAADAVEQQMLAPLAPGDVKQLTALLRACIQALAPDA